MAVLHGLAAKTKNGPSSRRPDTFVYGWIEGGQAYHLTLASLLVQPIVNCRFPDAALLVTFDPDNRRLPAEPARP